MTGTPWPTSRARSTSTCSYLDDDFHGPGFSGLKPAKRARRRPHRKNTPIVLISLEDISEEALRAGPDAFLRKPNNLIELVDTVRRLLAARAEGA